MPLPNGGERRRKKMYSNLNRSCRLVVGEICENFSFLSPAPWRLQHRTFFLYGENCSRIVGCWAHRRENPQSDQTVRERENEWVAVESSLPFEFQWLAIASAILITIQETPRDFPCRSEKLFAKFEIENFSRLSLRCTCAMLWARLPPFPPHGSTECVREEMKIYDNSLQSIPYCEWNEMKWNGKEKRVKWSDSEPTREDSWNQSWNSFEIKFHALMSFDIYPTFFSVPASASPERLTPAWSTIHHSHNR